MRNIVEQCVTSERVMARPGGSGRNRPESAVRAGRAVYLPPTEPRPETVLRPPPGLY
jgi:hypothetical protein